MEKYSLCVHDHDFDPVLPDAPVPHYGHSTLMVTFQKHLNRLFIFALCAILIAAFFYQIVKGEEPCSLCFLQRLGMTGIAIALLMNLRFGIQVQYYGLAVLSALLGRIVALRQISFHICPEIPIFGETVLGFDLYLWSFFIFTSSLFACAVLLILYGYSKNHEEPLTWSLLDKLAFWLIALITVGNIINALLDCNLTSCI
jgi:hypothetical protein